MGTRWALSWFVCSCKVAVKFGLSSLCHLSEGEWSNECEPILFEEVLSKGNVNKGIASFRRRNVDSCLHNYTCMYVCHALIFIQTKTAVQPLRNPA